MGKGGSSRGPEVAQALKMAKHGRPYPAWVRKQMILHIQRKLHQEPAKESMSVKEPAGTKSGRPARQRSLTAATASLAK